MTGQFWLATTCCRFGKKGGAVIFVASTVLVEQLDINH
jgi:hypothetical protein